MSDPLDLVALLLEHPAVHDVYMRGRIDGRAEGLVDGFAHGWAACDAELARLQAAAARIVHQAATLDPHEVRRLKSRIHTLEAALHAQAPTETPGAAA